MDSKKVMEKQLNIDLEKMTATVPLTIDPMILMVSEREAKLIPLPEYGEFIAKMHDGTISRFAVTETGKF